MAYLHISQQKNQNISNPLAFFNGKTSQHRRAFAALNDCNNRFEDVIPSQTYLADQAGVHRRTIQKWMSEWKSAGFYESQQRLHHRKNRLKTNRYSLHPLFFNDEVRGSLSTLPEFSVVFKCAYVPKIIEYPKRAAIRVNIKIKASGFKSLSENLKVDNQYYGAVTKNNVLLGTTSQLNSTVNEPSSSCLSVNPQYPTGYDPNMTNEEKKAYVLARSAALASQKSTPSPKQSKMPEGLSSYEQGQWYKQNLLDQKGREDLNRLSRERLESSAVYEKELTGMVEKERRESIRERDRYYR